MQDGGGLEGDELFDLVGKREKVLSSIYSIRMDRFDAVFHSEWT